MPNDDREQKFERALVRHLKNASPDAACPDAETLAAYHERSLSLEEMAQWKEHIAGCARCQESLALVEQSEFVTAEEWERSDVPVLAGPAPTPARKAAQIRWHWVVPVGALAASVIVWVSVREVRLHQAEKTASVEMAKNQPSAEPLRPPVSMAQENQQANEDSSAHFEARNQPPSAVPGPIAKTESAEELRSDGIMPRRSADTKVLDKEQASSKQKDLNGAVGGAVATPPPEISALRDEYAKGAREMAAPAPVLTAPTAPAASAGRSLSEAKKAPGPSATQATQSQVQVQAQAVGPANTTSNELALNARNRNLADMQKVATGDFRYIVTPGGKNSWRLGNAGVIERSSDKGKTWKPQNSSVYVDLTAGSATSDKLCWVVGKAGTILLTTDGGQHWKQIPSPIAGDLSGVQATDAQHASVWDAAHGQSFETQDGGQTWQQTANK